MLESALEKSLFAAVLLLLISAVVYLFYPAIVVAASDHDASSAARQVQPQTIASSSSKNSAAAAMATTTPLLTLVIPAFDEEERLPKMLLDAYKYLNDTNRGPNNNNTCPALADLSKVRRRRSPSSSDTKEDNIRFVIEWIVVNDGSNDGTCQVYQNLVQKLAVSSQEPSSSSTARQQPQHQHIWKLLSFPQNAGKGAAVRAGMLAATGDFCLMVDADGATDFGPGLEALARRRVELMLMDEDAAAAAAVHTTEDEDDRAGVCSSRCPIMLGSRAHLHHHEHNNNNKNGKRRSPLRSFLMQAFHICVVVFIGASDICDTQCGFKLLERETAHHLFRLLHLRRWAFDTELLFLATHLQYPLHEVVVPWQEVEGSKLHTSVLNLALVSVGMLRDMVCVRLCYTLGLWKIRQQKEHSS